MDYHRRSIRLKGYDYQKPGLYFVTIDVQDKLKLFWDGERINKIGLMIEGIIREMPEIYCGIGIDIFVIMPDHVHFIIEINNNFVGADPRICPKLVKSGGGVGANPCICPEFDIRKGRTQGSARTFGKMNSLAGVIQRFKMLTTKRYVDGVNVNGWPRFRGKLWQRNYYERIIRDEMELNRIRKYIRENRPGI